MLFWVTFAAWFSYVTVLLRSESPGPQDRHTSTLLLVCTIGALGAAFGFAYWWSPSASAAPAASMAAGLALVWVSLVLSEWSRLCLGAGYHPVITSGDGQSVVTHGPYRLIRHPIYAARILSLAGVGLAMSNWLSLGVCILLPSIGFIVRINAEERAMLTSSGIAYATYSERTSRPTRHLVTTTRPAAVVGPQAGWAA